MKTDTRAKNRITPEQKPESNLTGRRFRMTALKSRAYWSLRAFFTLNLGGTADNLRPRLWFGAVLFLLI